MLTVGASALFPYFLSSALQFAPASDAGILAPGTLPFWAALSAFLLMGDRPNKVRQFGLLCIIAGALSIAIWEILLTSSEMEGAGSIPKHDLNNAGKGSEEVLEAMRSEGKNIMHEQSYVVGNAIFCVYNAENEELIREHSERSGAPANGISEITTVIKHNTSFVT